MNEKLLSSGGFLRFQHELTAHLLLGGVCDNMCMNGTIDPISTAYNIWCRFGFGRVQKTSDATWYVGEHKMLSPTLKSSTSMSNSLKRQLMTVIEFIQVFVEQHYKDSFPDHQRTTIFAGRVHCALGFSLSRTNFEHYDIVPSRNTILRKHIDHKNDLRNGYNYCVVYFFFQKMDGVDCHVSIVATTRSTVGCPNDKVIA